MFFIQRFLQPTAKTALLKCKTFLHLHLLYEQEIVMDDHGHGKPHKVVPEYWQQSIYETTYFPERPYAGIKRRC